MRHFTIRLSRKPAAWETPREQPALGERLDFNDPEWHKRPKVLKVIDQYRKGLRTVADLIEALTEIERRHG